MSFLSSKELLYLLMVVFGMDALYVVGKCQKQTKIIGKERFKEILNYLNYMIVNYKIVVGQLLEFGNMK